MSAVLAIAILLIPLAHAMSLPLASTCSCECPTKGSVRCPAHCSRCATTSASCNCTTACGYWPRCESNYCLQRTDHANCWLGMDRAVCSRSCNLMTSTCVECVRGYFGEQCRQACPSGGPRDRICGGHGRCHDGVKGSGRCTCWGGYAGPRCEFSDRDTCNSNGEVDDKGQCKCNRGYTGKACQYNDYLTCSGHGRVDADGKCVCKPLWKGSDCSQCAGFSVMGGCVSPSMTSILALFATLVAGLSCGCLAWAVDSARRPTYRAAAHLKPTGPSYNTFGDDGAASAGYRSAAGSETATAGPGESVATCLSGDPMSILVSSNGPSLADGPHPEPEPEPEPLPPSPPTSPAAGVPDAESALSSPPLPASATASPSETASPFAQPAPSSEALAAVDPMDLLSPPYPASQTSGEREPFPSTVSSANATPRLQPPPDEPPSPPFPGRPPLTNAGQPPEPPSPPTHSAFATPEGGTNPPSPPCTPLSPPVG
eukprot:EG_transcript_10281